MKPLRGSGKIRKTRGCDWTDRDTKREQGRRESPARGIEILVNETELSLSLLRAALAESEPQRLGYFRRAAGLTSRSDRDRVRRELLRLVAEGALVQVGVDDGGCALYRPAATLLQMRRTMERLGTLRERP